MKPKCVLLSLLLVLSFAATAEASCALCSANATCAEAPSGWSGNCSCNIKPIAGGGQICKPVGVCDPNDPNTCEEGNEPRPKALSDSVRVGSPIEHRLSEIDPILGAAFGAAIDYEYGPGGLPGARLVALGLTQGATIALGDGRSYAIEVRIDRTDANTFAFELTLDPFHDGEMVFFSGSFDRSGQSGTVIQPDQGVQTWGIGDLGTGGKS